MTATQVKDGIGMSVCAISWVLAAYWVCTGLYHQTLIQIEAWDNPRPASYTCQERAYGGEVCGWYR